MIDDDDADFLFSFHRLKKNVVSRKNANVKKPKRLD
jgi:hypothetical protein